MKVREIGFEGCNDRKVEGKLYHPETENPPGILIVHGFGGLRNYYHETAKRIAENGFTVMVFRFSAYNSFPDLTKLSIKDELGELKSALNILEGEDIDKDRIGILSHSLGSCISVISNDNRVSSYVLMAFVPHLKSVFSEYIFSDENIRDLEDKGSCERKSRSTGKVSKMGAKLWDEVKNVGEIKEGEMKKIENPKLLIYGEDDRLITEVEMKET